MLVAVALTGCTPSTGPAGPSAGPPGSRSPSAASASTASPSPLAPSPPAPNSPGTGAPGPSGAPRFARSYVVAGLGALPEAAATRLAQDASVGDVVAVRVGDLAVASGLPAFPEVPVEARFGEFAVRRTPTGLVQDPA